MDAVTEPIPPADAAPLWQQPWFNRLVAGGVCAACLTVLGLAAWLQPNAAGVGTHTQLGMQACSFYESTALPCATCGMTTTFALAADGRLVAAAINQPAAFTLAVLTACAAMISGWAMYAGVSLLPLVRAVWTPKAILLAGGVLIAAWAYKIALAMTA